jgi:hypothetical protein
MYIALLKTSCGIFLHIYENEEGIECEIIYEDRTGQRLSHICMKKPSSYIALLTHFFEQCGIDRITGRVEEEGG